MTKVRAFRNGLLWAILPGLLVFLCWSSEVLGQTYSLRVTNPLQQEALPSKALENWGKELEKRSNGRIKIKYYPDGTLAPMPQQYDAVIQGMADVGMAIFGSTIGRFPQFELMDLPVGWSDASIATKIANEYYGKFKPKELAAVKVLWLHGMGPGWVCMLKKPVNKLEDMKGQKIRTGGNNTSYMKALGGTPVGMPMPETYDALSRGMLDGVLASYEALESYRLGDFVKFVTENKESAFSSTFMIIMNKKVWDSLPKDIQSIIDQLSKEQPEKFAKAWEGAYVSGKTFVTKRGAKIISLSKEEEARWFDAVGKPLIEDYVKRMKEKDLPGEESVKFVQDRIRALKKEK